MLGRLILILLQIIIAWIGAPIIVGYVKGVPADWSLFLYALIFAIIVFLVGLIAAQVLRDIGTPSSATLSWALVFALIGAALATWGPLYLPEIGRIDGKFLALAGAVLGYMMKR